MTDRAVIWAPSGVCHSLARDLGCEVLWPGMGDDERRRTLERFKATDRALLVVSCATLVHGWRMADATTYFADGCPEDKAWRWQAEARSRGYAG